MKRIMCACLEQTNRFECEAEFTAYKAALDRRGSVQRSAAGKKLPSAEEHILRSAENILNHEFAAALGIKPEEVAGFISDRLNSHNL